MAGAGLNVLVEPLRALLRRSQQAVAADDVDELAAVEVLAAKLPRRNLGGLLLRGVDGYVGEESPLETVKVASLLLSDVGTRPGAGKRESSPRCPGSG